MNPLCVMIVTGEASGDDRGAGLARALRALLGDGVRFVGVGGRRMAQEGIVSPFDIAEISILGLFDGLFSFRKILRRVTDAADLAARENPDIVVLIDSWGFTLRVAQAIRAQTPHIPLVKYVGPQIWATRPGRAKTLAKVVDHLLTIHSFDAPMFEAAGLTTTFVGNAALSVDFSKADPERLRRTQSIPQAAPILLVLPGSRPSEVRRILPAFQDAVSLLRAEFPSLAVVIPAAPTVVDIVRAVVAGWADPVHIVEGDEAKLDAMKASVAALACSGTVTLEVALAGCPMVVGYRLDTLTWEIASRLLRTPYVTLFNIAAQRFVAPELLQNACTGPALAAAVSPWIESIDRRRVQVDAQFAALDLMGRGGPDPSHTAAEAVLRLASGKQ